MTDAFTSGADLMAAALGAPGYRFAVIDHPIASADDDELRRRAAAAVDQATRLLLG